MIAAFFASPSDWFSPVLVKEMRQGLKNRAFVAVFVTQHVLLLFAFAIPLVQADRGEIAEATGFFFWLVAVSGLVVLMPLAGMNAIAQEKKEHTLELVLLTRLTAWRVVFGKWGSLVTQTALLASGLLPYLVVRYYLGGVNLVVEALALALLVLFSGLLTAISVLASTYGFVLARLLVIGLQGGLGMVALGLLANLMRGSTLSATFGSNPWELAGGVALGFAVLGLVVYFLLQVAATRIAPPAENHAATKRLAAVTLVLLPCLPIGEDARQVLVAGLFPVIGLMALDACAEPLSTAPTAYLPYARVKGGLRPLAILGYPGWPSGLVVAAILSAALAGLWGWADNLTSDDTLVLGLACLACVATPVALARLLRRHTPLMVWALLFHVLTGGGALVLGGIAEVLSLPGGREFYASLFPLPAAATVANGDSSGLVALVSSVAWLGLAALLLTLRGRADLRFLGEMEARARAQGDRS